MLEETEQWQGKRMTTVYCTETDTYAQANGKIRGRMFHLDLVSSPYVVTNDMTNSSLINPVRTSKHPQSDDFVGGGETGKPKDRPEADKAPFPHRSEAVPVPAGGKIGADEDTDLEPTHKPTRREDTFCETCTLKAPDALIQCVQSGEWHCNERQKGQRQSCIMQHMEDTGYNQLARVVAGEHRAIACVISNEPNVFRLGWVANGKQGLIISESEANNTNQEANWKPLAQAGGLASWLARRPTTQERTTAVCITRRQRKTKSNRPTIRTRATAAHADGAAYASETYALLREVREGEEYEHEQKTFTTVPTEWVCEGEIRRASEYR